MANQTEQLVEKIVLDLLKDKKDIELVDVEYVKEQHWYLRVFIDKDGGIEIDDCQELSEQLEERLDKTDPIKERYILEISSPGLDRVLKKERDFKRETGKMIDITTYAPIDGKKEFVGKLTGFDKETITIDDNQVFSLDKVAMIRLHIEF
jgi:ribosome maturation factor RimP